MACELVTSADRCQASCVRDTAVNHHLHKKVTSAFESVPFDIKLKRKRAVKASELLGELR